MNQASEHRDGDALPKATVSADGWRMLALIGCTQLLSFLDRNILAILNPRIKHDLAIGDAEMGLLYGTVFAFFYALFSLPIGRLADGWNRTRLLAIAILVWSASTGLAAFAGGFALLAISRLGVGIGEAAAQPAGTSLVYDHFPKARRGLAMAVMAAALATGLGLSSVLGGVAAGWWDARYAGSPSPFGFSGWQFAFLVAAAPGIVLAWAMWRAREPVRGLSDGVHTPEDPAPFRAAGAVFIGILPGGNWFTLWHRNAGMRQWMLNLAALLSIIALMYLAISICAAHSPRPPLVLGGMAIDPHVLQWSIVGLGLFVIVNLVQSQRLDDREAFDVIYRSPTVLLCMAVGALQTMINYGVMGFTPAFLMKTYGLSPAVTGLQFGLLAAAIGIVGPVLAGPLADIAGTRYGTRGRLAVTLFSLALSPLLQAWMYRAPDPATFYWRFGLYSLLLTMWLPPLYAALYDQVMPRMRAMTASLYLFVTTILGLGVGPYLVGILSDARGGDIAAAVGTINLVAPLIVLLLLVILVRGDRVGQR